MTITATATPTAEADEAALDKIEPTSLTDLKDQLESAGLSCDHWDVTVKNFAGSCDDLILLTYDDGKKNSKLFQLTQYTAWGAIRDQKREGDVALLVGDNWWIRVGLVDAKSLHDDLGTGGVILH